MTMLLLRAGVRQFLEKAGYQVVAGLTMMQQTDQKISRVLPSQLRVSGDTQTGGDPLALCLAILAQMSMC
jgi:hypothetical protein